MQCVGAVRTVLYIVSFELLGSRGTGDIEELGGLAIGQAGVLDFLPDLWRSAGLGMNTCAYGLKFMRCAATDGTIEAANRRSTRQARPWRGTKPCYDEEYDRTKLNSYKLGCAGLSHEIGSRLSLMSGACKTCRGLKHALIHKSVSPTRRVARVVFLLRRALDLAPSRSS